MKSKKISPTVAPPIPVSTQAVDSKGNRRIYVDLPTALIVEMNIMAAVRGVTKRSLISALLTEAVGRATREGKL